MTQNAESASSPWGILDDDCDCSTPEDRFCAKAERDVHVWRDGICVICKRTAEDVQNDSSGATDSQNT